MDAGKCSGSARGLYIHIISCVACVALWFLGVHPVAAQSTQAAGGSYQATVNQVDVARFPDVTLFVSVLDANGKLLQGLSEGDFVVKEDEVEQSPVSVRAQLPAISSALVVDGSGSMKNAMSDAQRAATTFIDNAREGDETLVIAFADDVKVVQPLTTDKAPLRNAIRGIKARGNTALYDALYEGVQSFRQKKGRKVIILLTDGRDDDGTNKQLSVKTVDQVIAAANETNVPVFAIGLGKSVDEGILKRIADQTGGRFFLSPSSADLEHLYREIGAQLEGQYVLSYKTDLSEQDGSWHRVVVAVKGSFGQKQYKAPQGPEKAAAPPPVKMAQESAAKTDSTKQAVARVKEEAPKDALNVLAASQGTRILYATSQYDTGDWAAKNLIDGAIGKGHGYSSVAFARGQGVQEILFELPKTAAVSGLIVDPYTVESEQQWAKDIELGVSVTDPHGEFTTAGAFTIDNKRIESQDPAYSLTEQEFSFEPVKARWVKLILKTNHGGDHTQLGEVKLMGVFTGEEPTGPKLKNVLAAENGGKLVYFTSEYDDSGWAARNLIDGKLGLNHQYASSGNVPTEICFVLPEPKKIVQIAFNPYATEAQDNWAKDVEVEVSTASPKQGFKSIGKFTLHNKAGLDPGQPLPEQVFKVDPVDAKFIKLKLLSNHGGSYIEMGEFMAYSPEN